MIRSKRGQLFMLGLMLSVIGIVAVVVMIEPLKDVLTLAVTGLDCTNVSISTGNSMACIVVDFTLFAFVGVGIAVSIGFIAIKKVFGGGEGA